MRDTEPFDAFYRDARDRLLLMTYALTGDLGASRSAVRDAFASTWHHWRKISRQGDPEAAVRRYAWSHARRRHNARLWHREKGASADVQRTLDALGELSTTQRRALLLMLADVPTSQLAREVGLPPERAERELRTAADKVAERCDLPPSDPGALLNPLLPVVADVRWPRAPIVRRSGARRRRTQTAVGAVAAVAAVLLTGTLVTDAAGVRPTLDRLDRGPAAAAPEPEDPAPKPEPAPTVTLSRATLLSADQLGGSVGARKWAVLRTNDNAEGNGRVVPCQQERYADPRGTAALVRTFAARSAPELPQAKTTQLAEASSSNKAARRAFRTAREWYAGCTDARVQLLSTREVDGVGDEATQLVLRAWDAPVTTMVVGLARTGTLTTTTVTAVRNDAPANQPGAASVLAKAVDALCTLPEGGDCARPRPALREVPPLPAGPQPSLLSEVDLPPVSKVARPWVGTEPRLAKTNVAATRCDDASFQGRFNGAPVRNDVTRSYLIPQAKLPAEFGLTETQGSLPTRQATEFVEQVRVRLAGCSDKDLGTEVVPGLQVDEARLDLSVWYLTTELSDERSFDYAMAIMRRGTSVAQLSFVGAPGVQMTDAAFAELSQRALDRLAELPPPRRRG